MDGYVSTRAKKRKNEECHVEARQVQQRVSSFDASTSSTINDKGEIGVATQSNDAHNRQQLSWLDIDARVASSSGSSLGSSATLDTNNLGQFDVFLNHRGPDVKMTFVAHLHAALCRVGRKAFLDAESLVIGHHAWNSIWKALSGVLVHVAIFSPGYVESKYCLNELCDILASKKPVIPVFYKVKPQDLRWLENENGPFAKAFCHHLDRGRDQDVMKWRGALKEVASITGFEFGDNDNEEILVRKVVEAVLNALPLPRPLPPAQYPIGLEKTSRDIMKILHNMGNNKRVIGICGMGGIGKTTLAREVYNQEQSRYERCCFLEDVKDVSSMESQEKIVMNLIGKEATYIVGNYDRCFEIIQKRKVLLVVDDISKAKQFHKLIPNLTQLASESEIIITSRDSDLLHNIMANVSNHERTIFHMPQLDFFNSMELFMNHAFQKRHLYEVDASFHENVKDITKACDGLPLALEVIGRFLSNKKDQPKCWIEAISWLRKDEDIIGRLQISYEGLGDDEKDMFIEIACIMLRLSKNMALDIWKSMDYDTPNSSLNALIAKSLVKVDFAGQLQMHDLLRDMGQRIVLNRAGVRKVEKQSHIWDPSTIAKILKDGHGSYEVIAMSLAGIKTPMVCKAEFFAKMQNLRYLSVKSCEVNGDFSRWSKELKMLQWRDYQYMELPHTLNLQGLVVLDLAENINLTHIWDKKIETESSLKELRMLILQNCTKLKELPQYINKLTHLDLYGCSSLSSLPNSIGCISQLEILKLQRCISLTKLPESIGNLSNLEEMYASRCTLLQRLPTSFAKLTKISTLDISMTGIKELPMDFGQLYSLKRLYVEDCKSLVELLESIGDLSNLEVLRIIGCILLQRLPTSFGKLTKISTLDTSWTGIKELPINFGQLCSLKTLYVIDRKSLVELPESIGELSNLEEMYANGCILLQSLPTSFAKLTKISTLNISMTGIKELPMDFGQLCSLKTLHVTHCKSLVELPESIGDLFNLEVLRIIGCILLQRLPTSFAKLTKISTLDTSSTGIKELPINFGQLCSLKTLYVIDCKSLVELPESIGDLFNLEELQIGGCILLQRLPTSFGKLTKISTLDISKSGIKELPINFGQLCSLKTLYVIDCKSLVDLPESIGDLSNLEELQICGCILLQRLPTSFGKLTKISTLDISETGIKELPMDFGQLCSLKRLYVKDCKSLVELPESIGDLSNLGLLTIRGCILLQRLPTSFGKLTKILALDISMTRIKQLPKDFGQLCSLKRLYVKDCKSLVELPESIGDLSNLEVLNINECILLQRLPTSFSKLTRILILDISMTGIKELPMDFGQLYSLKYFYVKDCKSLVELPESIGELSNLEVLTIRGCILLQRLPTLFGKFIKISTLDISEIGIKELPIDFGQLCSLKTLYVVDCKSLVELPESIGELSNLEELRISGCILLQRLPTSFGKLTKISTLSISKTWIKELPMDFGQLYSLKRLYVKDCKSLVELPESIIDLFNLEELTISGCILLQRLPTSFGKFIGISTLSISRTGIKELPIDFGQLCRLKNLYVRDCKSLLELPESIGDLSNLEELKISGCILLQRLPTSFGKLTKISTLDISEIEIKELPMDFGQLCSLKTLFVADCKSLVELPESIGDLSNLEVLRIIGCILLQRLPTSFGKLTKISTLSISKTGIKELPMDVGQLGSLKRLYVKDCKSLVELPESIVDLSNLEVLTISGCILLQRLPTSFGKLTRIATLSISRTGIKKLPINFGQLCSLKTLFVVDCKNLVELPESIGDLSNLKELKISGCILLQRLPTSFCKLTKIST